MQALWRNRRQVGAVLKELGCGFLTVVLFSAPLWVLTVGWRGPWYAVVVLLGLIAVLAITLVVNRWLKRMRGR